MSEWLDAAWRLERGESDGLADLHAIKVAAYVPVTQECMQDAPDLWLHLHREFRRHLFPWEFPDYPCWPQHRLFPRWLEAILRQIDKRNR